ncbi:hypothetical protein, partial [Marinobacter persicus]
ENENRWRHHTGVAALAGTLAETVGKWSEKASQVGSRYALRLERTIGIWLRAGGRLLGIGTGVVMAVWDFRRGLQEFGEGNGWVGTLFIGSALGSSVALIAFSGWGAIVFGSAALATGIGIVLVVLVVVIAVLIEIFKDNKLQDWMERCYFGKFDKLERYQGSGIELKELDLALSDMQG